ncbi:hypothetical protein K438DRAFT_1777157 [Mycena galopus ATCC 62051]|nr:hypothetical protein K438DRAFT_1777157 [Mycena galopus ATCC 62051]
MSLTKRIRPFIGRNYLELRHLTFLVDYLIHLRPRPGRRDSARTPLFHRYINLLLSHLCVGFGSRRRLGPLLCSRVHLDYPPEHQNPAGVLLMWPRSESRSMARGFSLLTNAGHDWTGLDLSDCCAFSKPFRATTTIVRSVKAGSIVSGLEVIKRNLQHYPNLQWFKSCLGDITETMPGASVLRARNWQLRRQLNRGSSNKV